MSFTNRELYLSHPYTDLEDTSQPRDCPPLIAVGLSYNLAKTSNSGKNVSIFGRKDYVL